MQTPNTNRDYHEIGYKIVASGAPLLHQAMRSYAEQMAHLDGHPSAGDFEPVSGGGTDATSVEAAMMRRYQLRADKEQLRDWLQLMEETRQAIHRICLRIIQHRADDIEPDTLPRFEVTLCDGRRFEGAHIPWVPYSRDEDNGWHDPTCVDPADESGLCPKCRVREARWRRRNGIPERANNSTAPAA